MKKKDDSRKNSNPRGLPEYAKKDPFKFDPIGEWIWRKFETSHVVDPFEFISQYRHRYFFVGTDSQNYPKSRKCVFTSVIIAYDYDKKTNCGHGATAIRYVDKRPLIPVEALSSRLMVEAQRSIEICKFLEETLLDLSIEDEVDPSEIYTQNIKGVTIDVNDDLKHKSGRYKDMLVGMIMAYGYPALCKPDSWASSSVADRKC